MNISVSKKDVNNHQLIRDFLTRQLAVKNSSTWLSLGCLFDKNLEKIYQNGGRPKSGKSNNPEGYLSEEDSIYQFLKKDKSEFMQYMAERFVDVNAIDRNKLQPPTLFEWFFERVCIDLKLMSNVPKEEFSAYIIELCKKAEEGEAEAKQLGERYNLKPEMAFSERFFTMSPPEQYYFTALLNKAALLCLYQVLAVTYMEWYHSEISI